MVVEWVALICVAGGILALLAYIVLTFNRLVSLRNRIDNYWAQIDVQLKRRYDLIPNLIETVKGYMKHEKDTLTTITKLRSKLISGDEESRAQANNQITQALKTVFAVAENYPNLKANENFKLLQEELAGTENKIAYVRTAYNDAVLSYDNALEQFPSNMIAGTFGFKPKPYFQAEEGEKKAVKVKFD